MPIPSSSPLTGLSTGRSKPILLLTLSALITPRHSALAVAGGPLTSAPEVHDWSFPTGSFDARVLEEVQAVMHDLGGRGLLWCLGQQMNLPFELLQAYGPI